MREISQAQPISNQVDVVKVPVGELFRYKDSLWMRGNIGGFIANSSVLKSVHERGDCFCIRMEDGTMTAWKRGTIVEVVPAAIAIL